MRLRRRLSRAGRRDPGPRADQRTAADAARDDFVLTGSDRAADQAAARGQMEQAPAAVAELHAAPEAAPAAVEPAAPPAGRIEDFGETLHGARKHYAQQYAERMRLAETLPVAKHSLSETWPEPNYAKLIEDGADPFLVALAHASRDEIPAAAQQLEGEGLGRPGPDSARLLQFDARRHAQGSRRARRSGKVARAAPGLRARAAV